LVFDDTNHLLIRGMDMGRINNIIQKQIDERIEQKEAFLIERLEKLEKAVMELKSELSEIRTESPKKNEKGKAGFFSD
jgi:predicted nuclease with TOPRIM domain